MTGQINYEVLVVHTNSNIPIQNIYYMLAYAYQTLKLSEYKSIQVETFKNVEDLYTEILKLGIPVLIRCGLIKDYIRIDECSTVVRGKIDMNTSIKQNTLVNKKLVVIHDAFSEDILLNQIIKATLLYLIRSNTLTQANRRIFHGYLVYFSNVSDVELHVNLFKTISFNKQNIRYQFIIDICQFLIERVLFNNTSSDHFIHQTNDEQKLASLFEKFVYSFYKRETTYQVSRPYIRWKVDDDYYEALPRMQTDIVLKANNKVLIVDTKFYSNNMSNRYEKGEEKHLSSNIYQIYTYVNNWVSTHDEQVSGMLLYARTSSAKQPNHHYKMNGNDISIVNVDMNQDFDGIKNSLLDLVKTYLE